MFEETMPEIFPETSPGNFVWDPEMGKWVMSVFNSYQWDLNYENPEVFNRMVEEMLFLANQGVEVLRLRLWALDEMAVQGAWFENPGRALLVSRILAGEADGRLRPGDGHG